MSRSHYFLDGTELCAVCACRRGLHRYADEQCPNPAWLQAPGRGQDQWLWTTFRTHAQILESERLLKIARSTLQELYTGDTV